LAIAAGLLLVALLAGGYVSIFGGAASTLDAAASTPTHAVPLELISLSHQRQSGRLSITGLVRNPARAAAVERLSATALLFDQQGTFLTSASAAVDHTRLGAGDESPFVVSLEAPPTVARYRVSFRTDAGVVAHLDRRGQDPIAKELP
jgi:hypothetical protein